MDTNKVVSWLQVGANLGIILGLVLVGLQLKQSSDLLRVQLLYDESQSFINHERMMIGDNGSVAWAKSLEAPHDMSLADQRIMEGYLYAMAEQWRASHMLHELGFLGEEWKNRPFEESFYYLGNPYGRAWWKVYAEDTELPPELAALVQQQIDDSPDYTILYHERVKQELSDLTE